MPTNNKNYKIEEFLSKIGIPKLEKEQVDAVEAEDEFVEVIARAGSGKTTTIAAKVKYLIEQRNLSPDEILIISFTKKAVGELVERLIKLKINYNSKILEEKNDFHVKTFHKLGKDILSQNAQDKRKYIDVTDDKYYLGIIANCLNDRFNKYKDERDKIIRNFPEKFKTGNKKEEKELITFFDDIYSDKQEEDLEKEIEMRMKKYLSIKADKIMRSWEEVTIANFLFKKNIEYEYEKLYPDPLSNPQRKPPRISAYRPDFTLTEIDKYIEHFGVDKNGNNNTLGKDGVEDYLERMEDKRIFLGNKLIESNSAYNENEKEEVIERELMGNSDINSYIENNPIDDEEANNKRIHDQIKATRGIRYLLKFANEIRSYISNYKKTHDDDIIEGLKKIKKAAETENKERKALFLGIVIECYNEYINQRYKEENSTEKIKIIDFEDMINLSCNILNNNEKLNGMNYKYIIIDEFQDITTQNFNLIHMIKKKCGSKIFVVGDDWQSIFGFANSNMSIFKNPEKIIKGVEPRRIEINKTYRCPNKLIEIANEFIKHDRCLIEDNKDFPQNPNNNVELPIAMIAYESRKDKGKKLFEILEKISKENTEKRLGEIKVLILGRYINDLKYIPCGVDNVERSYSYTEGFVTFKNVNKQNDNQQNDNQQNDNNIFKNLAITYHTVHSAKGKEADYVILVNAKSGNYGFPCEQSFDKELNKEVFTDEQIEEWTHLENENDFSEERRLFYVALTRTKNKIYILIPSKNNKYEEQSKYITEIKKYAEKLSSDKENNEYIDSID